MITVVFLIVVVVVVVVVVGDDDHDRLITHSFVCLSKLPRRCCDRWTTAARHKKITYECWQRACALIQVGVCLPAASRWITTRKKIVSHCMYTITFRSSYGLTWSTYGLTLSSGCITQAAFEIFDENKMTEPQMRQASWSVATAVAISSPVP